MTKYCGFEIGMEISCEQVERLFNFLHANYPLQELIMFDDGQLNEIARRNQNEWW